MYNLEEDLLRAEHLASQYGDLEIILVRDAGDAIESTTGQIDLFVYYFFMHFFAVTTITYKFISVWLLIDTTSALSEASIRLDSSLVASRSSVLSRLIKKKENSEERCDILK